MKDSAQNNQKDKKFIDRRTLLEVLPLVLLFVYSFCLLKISIDEYNLLSQENSSFFDCKSKQQLLKLILWRWKIFFAQIFDSGVYCKFSYMYSYRVSGFALFFFYLVQICREKYAGFINFEECFGIVRCGHFWHYNQFLMNWCGTPSMVHCANISVF